MAIVDGMRGFDARRAASPPLIVPKEKLGTDTTMIRRGHPVVSSSGDIIRRAALTGSAISDAKILGFAAEDDSVPAADLPAQFGRMPAITRPSGRQEVRVYPASADMIFTAAVASGQIPQEGHVGGVYNLKYDSAIDQFSVDVLNTSNGLVTIVGIVPGSLGVLRGRVDFIVQSGDSQWQSGA